MDSFSEWTTYTVPVEKKRIRRKVVGLRNYKNYTLEMLDLAVEMVDKKMLSSRDAEKKLRYPKTNHIK